MKRETTNPHIVPVQESASDKVAEAVEDVADRIIRRLLDRAWKAIPAKKALAWVAAVVVGLGGAGVGLKDYVPITVSSVWASKTALTEEVAAREAADAELRKTVDAVKASIAPTLYETLVKFEKEKTKGKRR
jgi:hypothetical protein